MRHVVQSIHVRRPPHEVFEVLADLPRYRRFFVGINRWEPVEEVRHDVGDRYWTLMRMGANSVGGVVRITALEPPQRVAWVSERGTEHEVTITAEPRGDGTDVTIDLAFRLAGGAPSRFIEWLSSSMVRRNLIATLEALRHLCEWGPADGLGSRP